MIEDWALRGMQRWPNVPALFGWLGLDRRGRWLIRGEVITRPQIIETIGRNYAADAQGRWYFQNGPQRGYVALEAAPLVLRVADRGDGLVAHTGQAVAQVAKAFLDERGALLLDTDLGPGLLLDSDLGWALERLRLDRQALEDDSIEAILRLPSGSATDLRLRLATGEVAVARLDLDAAPQRLGYVREPQADSPAAPASAALT
ncbi:MAG: hypothetical protein NVS9B10_22490 [Nevskia sp.]